MAADFDAYLRCLAKDPLDDKTEHTDRACLETLLRQAADAAEPGAKVQHEPRRDKAGAGSPDYKITRGGRIAGYVEAKQIDENLSKVLKSDQIKKYRALTDNLILTDYLEFVWIKPGGDIVRERLAHSDDLSGRKLALKPDRVEAVRILLRGFFSAAPARIGRGPDLAVALARRAALLRDFLAVELQRQTKEHREGRLHALYDVFRKQVFHDLPVGDFADAFAQMLAYGLFLARLNAGERDTVTLENVRQHIPGSFALIRELVRFLEEMNERDYADIRWVIEEVLSIVNGLDLAAIHEDLSFRARKAVSRKVRAGDEEEHRLFEKDPFIYFYEDFLKAYDPALRKSRGVYYTPPPVVNFIIRAIDDILKDTFGIERGLADHEKVTVLDFACGTGTFLLEAFEKIFETIGGPEAGQADQIVREHLTKNLYGFEYLIAPYTIAHLKLSQYLKDKGHPLKDGERLQVFLTNTLEPVEPQRDLMLPALSREVEAAQAVKDKPILVITGNPPYSAASKNRGKWTTGSIEPYKQVDGTPFGERKHWLHDDYVKFIRFSQIKMDEAGKGIVGIICNNSWLDNPTFRGMRQSLISTFDQIYVLNLHGSSKLQEKSPDGSQDENIFDIEQGVSIVIFIKTGLSDRYVHRSDVWGRRIAKYRYLTESSTRTEPWRPIDPQSPFYIFDADYGIVPEIYKKSPELREIFESVVPGIITARDEFAIGFTEQELVKRIDTFSAADSDRDAALAFDLKSSRGWSVVEARRRLDSKPSWRAAIKTYMYRPFDSRLVAHDIRIIDWGRWSVFDRMKADTISLVSVRQVAERGFDHALVTNALADNRLTRSAKGTCYQFPIRLSGDDGIDNENFQAEFRTFLDARYDHHYTPEEITGYIYAVLYAPTYRSRYAEFLRIDFPRIPFPEAKPEFDALSDLGWTLVQAHLLNIVPKPPTRLGRYPSGGNHSVDIVRYAPAEEAIWINTTQRFAPVPQAVWDFRIGGYQVLDKYLKSRKGRTLNLDETIHVGRVAETLAFTIDQMARIDAAYLAAFPTVDNAAAPLAPAS